jgi:hypothetical protein
MSSRRPLEGLIEAPSGTIDTKRYKMRVDGKSMILTVFEELNSLTFYLGGYKIYCVDAQITKDDEGIFHTRGFLTKVRYDTQCAHEGEFKRGSDTTMILKLMMTYIKNNYPEVKTMKFTDLSTRICDNGASISLSAMKLFIDGRSWYLPVPEEQEGMPSTGEKYFASGWYEDHFGAKIYPNDKLEYNSIIENANAEKHSMTWQQFCNRYLSRTKVPETKVSIEEIYNTSNTWQEFFKKIRDDIGISALCIWFSENSWFHITFLRFMKFDILDFKFFLTPSNFSQEYTIEPFTGGWRGVTRKAKGQKASHRRHLRCKK